MSKEVKQLIAENLGPVLLGIFINTYLYGLVSYQYGAYFLTKFDDPLWIKSTVLSLFLLDTLHSAALVWMAWVYLIEGFNDFIGLMTPVWPYPFTIAVTALTAFLTQLFLSYRVYRLTKGKLWYAGITIAAAGTLILGFVCTVKAWQVKLSTQLIGIRPYISAWLGLEMALDIIICGVLLYTLSQSRTGFARSDTIIRRLMRAAVQTGSFAGVFAVITLILFFTKADTQLYSLFGMPISRVYSNTLMDTILCRGELRDIMQSEREGTAITSLAAASTMGQNSIQLHIQKEVHVEQDRSSMVPTPRSVIKYMKHPGTGDKVPPDSPKDSYPPFHAY